jgi:DNA (cytosine-5)-methyltransferase 1
MNYLSLFSGIEAATQAWHPLGWKCVGVSEIEPFPCAVLTHHYPTVPNLGDVTKITEEDIKTSGHIDIVVFGSPCQDLSVAGLRKGFTCESTDTLTRSGLFFVAMRIIAWARQHCGCRFALWENVPGAFSSSKGRDFATVVEHMAGLENLPVPPNGWGTEGVAAGSEGLVEWAVLDAQWFGVAQRRRRVFALADFGNWANRPPILLEPESLRGDSSPSRKAREEVAPTVTGGAPFSRTGNERLETEALVWPADVASTLDTHFGDKQGLENQHVNSGCPLFVPVAFPERMSGTQCASAENLSPSLGAVNTTAVCYDTTQITSPLNFSSPKAGDPCHPLANGQHPPLLTFGIDDEQNAAEELMGCLKARTEGGVVEGTVAYGIPGNWIGRKPENGGNAVEPMLEVSPCQTKTDRHGVSTTKVRRLTPVECARLQGFPDDYLDITFRGKPAADGNKYKALGNSMAVPVMSWIGKQIQECKP